MSEVFHPFGHLEGIVTKVNDHGRGHVTFEVAAVNGGTCFGSDIYGDVRPFPIAVGRQILERNNHDYHSCKWVYC